MLILNRQSAIMRAKQKPAPFFCDAGTIKGNCDLLGLPMPCNLFPFWEMSGRYARDLLTNNPAQFYSTATGGWKHYGAYGSGATNERLNSVANTSCPNSDYLTAKVVVYTETMDHANDKIFGKSYNTFGTWSSPYLVFDFERSSSTSKLAAVLTRDGESLYSLASASDITYNTESVYHMTYDGTDLKLYMDGVLDNSVNLPGVLDQRDGVFYFLAEPRNTTPYEMWTGSLVMAVVWPTAMSADQVAIDYENQYGLIQPVQSPIYFDMAASPADTFVPQIIIF